MEAARQSSVGTDGQLLELRTQNANLEEQVERLKKKKAGDLDVVRKLNERIGQVQREKAQEIEGLRTHVGTLEKELAAATTAVEAEKGRCSEAQTEVTRLESAVQELETALEQAAADAAKERELKAAQVTPPVDTPPEKASVEVNGVANGGSENGVESTAATTKELTASKERNEELEERVRSLLGANDLLRVELQSHAETKKNLANQVSALSAQVAQMTESQEASEQQIRSLEASLGRGSEASISSPTLATGNKSGLTPSRRKVSLQDGSEVDLEGGLGGEDGHEDDPKRNQNPNCRTIVPRHRRPLAAYVAVLHLYVAWCHFS